jgi:hypothetical protein
VKLVTMIASAWVGLYAGQFVCGRLLPVLPRLARSIAAGFGLLTCSEKSGC